MNTTDIPPVFARYLVALGCWDRTPAVVAANRGEPYLRSFSGFVVSIRGTSWSVMTAGHAIRQMLDLTQKGHDLFGWHIDDSAVQLPPEGMSVPLAWNFDSVVYLDDGKRLATTVVDDGENRHQSGAHHFRFDGHHCDRVGSQAG